MVEISNVKVYNLEEAVVASGNAMRVDDCNNDFLINNLKQFTKDKTFLPNFDKFYKLQNKNIGLDNRTSCYKCGSNHRIQKFTKDGHYYCGKHSHDMHRYGSVIDDVVFEFVNDNDVAIHVRGEKHIVRTVLISSIDVPFVFGKRLKIHKNGYLFINDKLFHRELCSSIGLSFEEVDHIDRNPYNNTRRNLRPCLKRDNLRNRTGKRKDEIIGVCYDKSRCKWRAYIRCNDLWYHLGRYDSKEEAIYNRLIKENELFGEYSPNIDLFEHFGINYIIKNSLKDELYSLKSALHEFSRMSKLSKNPSNSGHPNAAKGILVSYDIKYPQYFTKHLQRYIFNVYVSSSSIMHRLIEQNEGNRYNEYVTDETKNHIQHLINIYNDDKTEDNWLRILSNCPLGLELFVHCTTNYLQLRNIYQQRKNHKLKDWKIFCKFIEELPYFSEFINPKND